MVAPKMLGALSFRTCVARRQKCGARPDLYTLPGFAFGGIPLVILLGDFMQLAPLDNNVRKSLLKEPQPPKPRQGPRWGQKADAMLSSEGFEEELNGYSLFWGCLTHVLFLHGTHRFVDQITKKPCPVFSQSSATKRTLGLFEYMRDPQGKKMPNFLWSSLQKMRCGPRDPRLQDPRQQDAYEMAIVWEGAMRLMQYRALREARASSEMLMYNQAIDVCTSEKLEAKDYRRALQVVNMTSTGKLMGMLPLFRGMRVRLMSKISAKHQLVQDAVGEVIGVQFDHREFADRHPRDDWRTNSSHPRRRDGIVRLRYMPRGVYVKMDKFKEDLGNGEGVILVRPTQASWKY